jgi:hypothetical protein
VHIVGTVNAQRDPAEAEKDAAAAPAAPASSKQAELQITVVVELHNVAVRSTDAEWRDADSDQAWRLNFGHVACCIRRVVRCMLCGCTRMSDDGSHIVFWKRITVERASFAVHPPRALRAQSSFEPLRDVPLELRIQERPLRARRLPLRLLRRRTCVPLLPGDSNGGGAQGAVGPSEARAAVQRGRIGD